MKNVPFFDLRRQYAHIHGEIDRAIKDVLSGGVFTGGESLSAFENAFAAYCGVNHAVGVASGTDALTLAIRALGLGAGDEVIVPANVYPTAFGVAASGVTMKLIDCKADGTLDPDRLGDVLHARTRAVVAVHLYGKPADLPAVIINTHQFRDRIYLIEDCAQAHGAMMVRFTIDDSRMTNGDKKERLTVLDSKLKKNINYFRQSPTANRQQSFHTVGTIGDIGCFSFYPTKNVGAYGDGGVVITRDADCAVKLRQLRQYGERERYQSVVSSGISRLDTLQAAILSVKLRHLDEWNRRRHAIAQYYSRELAGVGDITIVQKDDENEFVSAHHICAITTTMRDKLQAYLADNGVQTVVHYPVPIHLTPAFSSLGYSLGDFPVAEELSRTVLSLPLFPELRDNEVAYVCTSIRRFFSGK